jgi:predicted dehydrogenase
MTIRVAILGASGIGFIHARHYSEQGAQVVAILCSTQVKANSIAEKMLSEFGIKTTPYCSLEKLLREDLDAVSVCTPAHLHIENIKACFERNLAVFCEKPLFWNDTLTSDEVSNELENIEFDERRRIFVNTSNTVFIDAINQTTDKPNNYKNMSFEFYTKGLNLGIDIAKDLLPHGLSLMTHLLGDSEITDFSSQISDHIFTCNFSYASCSITFDFKEHPDGPRHLRIGLNGRYYNRVPTGSGAGYEVSLVDESDGVVMPVVDPFRSYIGRFLAFVESGGTKKQDDFFVGARNLKLMAKCLLLTEQRV